MAKRKPLFEVDHPLTTADLRTYHGELLRLQGNILKSHGRDAAVTVFLTFHPGKQSDVKKLLRTFANEITSAADQLAQTKRHKQMKGREPELFATLCLSAKGYVFLGLPIAGFSVEFQKGMRGSTAKLDDPLVAKWEAKFQDDTHALILLALDNVAALTRQLMLLRDRVSGFAEVRSEFGVAMNDQAGRVIEHFGYVDGRSQPLFFADDVKKDLKGEVKVNWDPSAGPNLVLVKDPLGKSNADCGSYYVFRKLEQNVKGFKTREQALADALKLTGDTRERAGAIVIGRFEDGTPVALNDEALDELKPSNNFAYPKADAPGNRCPFAGHIRKANPRGDPGPMGETQDQQRAHRIARRGITYGDPTPPGEDLDALPETGVGLLFQCCQADLAKQFEFVQQSFADNEGFSQPGTGRDPVIGQSATASFPDLKFPNPWGSPGRTPFSFHSFVTMKGGEYFFVPSISFLKGLS
jgi:Dyp-type peroxidase family